MAPTGSDVKLPLPLSMIIGGISGSVGEILTIPLDTAKVRQQVDGEKALQTGAPRKYVGTFTTLKLLLNEEGIITWYRGLSAGLLRQMVFASLRIGLYDPVRESVESTLGWSRISAKNNVLSGLLTGAFGILIASPTDRIKVVFQKNPDAYSSLRHAIRDIAGKDGVQGLWRGVGANMLRNAIINAAELATYDQVKRACLSSNILSDGIALHFLSSAIAGFTAVIFGNPVDVVKTRIMGDREKLYNGTLDCVLKTLRNEGPLAFYKGFLAQSYRIVSWNIAMFMTREQLRNAAAARLGKH